MNCSFEIENLRSPTTIDIGVKSKANYWQYTEALPIIRFRLSLGDTSESLLAEREGFKPPKRTSRFPDFESGPFGHSGISPEGEAYQASRLRSAKVATIIRMSNRLVSSFRADAL